MLSEGNHHMSSLETPETPSTVHNLPLCLQDFYAFPERQRALQRILLLSIQVSKDENMDWALNNVALDSILGINIIQGINIT